MAIILFIAGAVGFLASVIFLHLGLTQMAFRYPLAVLFAYGAFLFLLWLWVGRRNRRRTNRDLDPGAPDFDVSSSGSVKPELGGGGRFGGGGAGRSWDAPSSETATHFTSTLMNSPGGSGSFFDHLDFGIDLDEGALLLIPILLAVTVALAALYAIYLAPFFVFELVFDAALAGTFYARLRKAEEQNWLGFTLRRTWIPIALVVLAFALGGYALQHVAPHATSIGQVWASGHSKF